MTIGINEEILAAINDRGLAGRLIEERQRELEGQRNDLILNLKDMECGEDARTRELWERRHSLERRVVELEGQAAEARRLLNAVESTIGQVSYRIERIRFKVRALADKRIDGAIRELSELSDKARAKFVSWSAERIVDPLRPARLVDCSNDLEVGEVLAAVNVAIDKLDVLKEQPRPEDLPAVIAEIMTPVRDVARKLMNIG